MYFIAAFGLLMLLLSLVMAVKPDSLSKGIIAFSEKPYFHIVEVISRIIAGLIFINYSADTLFPQIIFAIGIVLFCVGIRAGSYFVNSRELLRICMILSGMLFY